MLHAILHGKAARVTLDGQDLSWREVFRRREDLLTAAFFGRFAYLSPFAQSDVLGLFFPKSVIEGIGQLQDIEFWPRIGSKDGGNYVEPDVLLYFEFAVVAVEVKGAFGSGQLQRQWSSELDALLEERDNPRHGRDIPQRIIFLALGEGWRDRFAPPRELTVMVRLQEMQVYVASWHWVFGGLADVSASYSPNDAAVIRDWIEAFRLFGISGGMPVFSDLSATAALPEVNELAKLLMRMGVGSW